jgi:hypothetical protein
MNKVRVAKYKVTLPIEITFSGSSAHDIDTIEAVAEIMLKEKVRSGDFEIDSKNICIVRETQYSREEIEEADKSWKEFIGLKR